MPRCSVSSATHCKFPWIKVNLLPGSTALQALFSQEDRSQCVGLFTWVVAEEIRIVIFLFIYYDKYSCHERVSKD